MANRVVAPNLFASTAPNWSLSLLDANAQNATGAINDSSLGSVNGPLTDTGSVNAYSVTCTYGTPSAYNNGMTVFFKPTTTNTGPSTLTVAPLSSLPITASDGTTLAGGELAAGVAIGVVCDGTAFRIFSFQGPSQITSVRLRSFSAVGNGSFEVDQVNAGQGVSTTGGYAGKIIDRWLVAKGGTAVVNAVQLGTTLTTLIPGTNFNITTHGLAAILTTPQATLAATDSFRFLQNVEGSQMRELVSDVHSVSLLVGSSVSPVHFSVCLRDNPTTKSIVYLCTYNVTAGQLQLITLPNIPVWASGGNWNTQPGNLGYIIEVVLAAGSSYIAPAGSWQNGTFLGAPGMDNFLANAANTSFVLYFIQHCPGSNVALIDCPFSGPNGNLVACQRYYAKSYDYLIKPGTVANPGKIIATSQPVSSNAAIAYTKFPVTMAKDPTVTFYSPATGAVNNIRNEISNADVACTNPWYPGDSGFQGAYTAAPIAPTQQMSWHYTSDTGW